MWFTYGTSDNSYRLSYWSVKDISFKANLINNFISYFGGHFEYSNYNHRNMIDVEMFSFQELKIKKYLYLTGPRLIFGGQSFWRNDFDNVRNSNSKIPSLKADLESKFLFLSNLGLSYRVPSWGISINFANIFSYYHKGVNLVIWKSWD